MLLFLDCQGRHVALLLCVLLCVLQHAHIMLCGLLGRVGVLIEWAVQAAEVLSTNCGCSHS